MELDGYVVTMATYQSHPHNGGHSLQSLVLQNISIVKDIISTKGR